MRKKIIFGKRFDLVDCLVTLEPVHPWLSTYARESAELFAALKTISAMCFHGLVDRSYNINHTKVIQNG